MYEGEVRVFHVYENEYRSLMHFLNDNMFIDGFGQCGGMGRCGTCALIADIDIGQDYHGNEANTLQKLYANTCSNIRLACQLSLDLSLHNRFLEICFE